MLGVMGGGHVVLRAQYLHQHHGLLLHLGEGGESHGRGDSWERVSAKVRDEDGPRNVTV